jgi:ABC-2 type transport system permease protein
MKISNVLRPTNRTLIRELVSSDFKLRYQGSLLGYLWSLLRPLMLFGTLYVVFVYIFNINKGNTIPHFPSYLLLGVIVWSFFTEATMGGLNAITGRGDLVKKVSIPKYVIVFSAIASAMVNFLLNLVVLAVFMIGDQVEIRATMLIFPLLLVELLALCLGLAFLLSALYVKFRDLSHIWEVILQVLFYATPILYLFQMAPPKLAKIMAINPLAQIIQDMRAMLITPATLTTKEVFDSQLGRIGPALIVLCILFASAQYFKRSSASFAEDL